VTAVYSFDAETATHADLKRGVTVVYRTRVVVAADSDAAAFLLAYDLAGARPGVEVTALHWRI